MLNLVVAVELVSWPCRSSATECKPEEIQVHGSAETLSPPDDGVHRHPDLADVFHIGVPIRIPTSMIGSSTPSSIATAEPFRDMNL